MFIRDTIGLFILPIDLQINFLNSGITFSLNIVNVLAFVQPTEPNAKKAANHQQMEVNVEHEKCVKTISILINCSVKK